MILIKCILLSVLISLGSCGPRPTSNVTVYVVVVDAGSTGSRAMAYKFAEKNDSSFQLLNERFAKTKPGLSAYANNPQEGAGIIISLINNATENFIPEEVKNKTRLYLRATAGLRLLGENKSQELLQAVQAKFNETEYNVTADAAGMLNGTDEGLLAWFTVNYLKKTLKRNHTLAALEMGGGSAQVTYEPQCQYINNLTDEMHTAPGGLRVFSHSYLGLGLSAGRQGILQIDYKQNLTDGITVESRCYDSTVPAKSFFFNNMNITVSGKKRQKHSSGVNLKKCTKRAKKIVEQYVKPKPQGLDEEVSVALSAFYYRGLAGKLITGEDSNITVRNIYSRAKRECKNITVEYPFLCMDLIFIHTLLTDGYGLKNSSSLEMIQYADGHELSWALGFAYSKLSESRNTTKSVDKTNNTTEEEDPDRCPE